MERLEKYFITALRSGYNRALTREEKNILYKAYKEISKEEACMSCKNGILHMLKVVGEEYYGNKRRVETEISDNSRLDTKELSKTDSKVNDRKNVGRKRSNSK